MKGHMEGHFNENLNGWKDYLKEYQHNRRNVGW